MNPRFLPTHADGLPVIFFSSQNRKNITAILLFVWSPAFL